MKLQRKREPQEKQPTKEEEIVSEVQGVVPSQFRVSTHRCDVTGHLILELGINASISQEISHFQILSARSPGELMETVQEFMKTKMIHELEDLISQLSEPKKPDLTEKALWAEWKRDQQGIKIPHYQLDY